MYADQPLARPPLEVQRSRKEIDNKIRLENLIAVGLVDADEARSSSRLKRQKNVGFQDPSMFILHAGDVSPDLPPTGR
jgi:hypothetical protein